MPQISKEELEIRLEKVEFALLNGFKPRQIAEQLNLSVRQIERDRKKIRKRNLELFRKSSPEDRLADLQADMRAIGHQAMKLAHSADKDSAKVSALQLLQHQADSKFKQYKDLGYVDVLPQRIELSGEFNVSLKKARELLLEIKEKKKKEPEGE